MYCLHWSCHESNQESVWWLQVQSLHWNCVHILYPTLDHLYDLGHHNHRNQTGKLFGLNFININIKLPIFTGSLSRDKNLVSIHTATYIVIIVVIHFLCSLFWLVWNDILPKIYPWLTICFTFMHRSALATQPQALHLSFLFFGFLRNFVLWIQNTNFKFLSGKS